MNTIKEQVLKIICNSDVSLDDIKERIKSVTEGLTKDDKKKLAKGLFHEFLISKLSDMSVQELIEFDLTRHFICKKTAGIDMEELIPQLVNMAYKAGFTECQDCIDEDGVMDVEKVYPTVERIYNDFKLDLSNIEDKEALEKELRAAIMFSMRAAAEKFSKGDYLDLIL